MLFSNEPVGGYELPRLETAEGQIRASNADLRHMSSSELRAEIRKLDAALSHEGWSESQGRAHVVRDEYFGDWAQRRRYKAQRILHERGL